MPTVKEYNRPAAVRYAEQWAYERNPAYYDFADIGGDCTNFVSQCLYAGSGVMNFTPETGWYYVSQNDRAPAWTSVRYLYDFLTTNDTRAVFATVADAAAMEIGDVVQLGDDTHFYHTLLVTGVVRNDLFVAAHSFDAYMRPLSSYAFRRARFLHIGGVYL